MVYLLGIDVGTSGTKTILIDETGRLVASAFADYPLSHPQPGWAEQQPEDWWKATVATVQEVVTKVKPDDIVGIGLSGQMHGSVFLDSSDHVLRPALLWCDQRTAQECTWITETVGAERLYHLTANPAMTGFTAPKIIWVRNHEPEIYDRIRKVLLPKDYIRFCLSGEFATEVSDASGTSLFDVRNRCWSKETLDLLGIPAEWMPEVHESNEVSSRLSASVAAKLGLPAGVPIVGGGGDQSAGAVGTGIVEDGIISASLGTSGVVFAYGADFASDPQQRLMAYCHAVPGRWHTMGVMLSAGASFQWFRNQLGQDEVHRAQETGQDPYTVLTEMASTIPVGSENLIFLPYLMGERTPYPDPNARGVFLGLSMRHTKAHLGRAVLEGITFGMRDSLEIIKSLGTPIREVRATGGGGKSAFWRQLQADIYGMPVVSVTVDEGPAFGVALLAGVGTGMFSSVEEACRATVKIATRTEPNLERLGQYQRFYDYYRTLYPLLRPSFAELASI